MFRVLRFTVAATLVIACIQLTVWVIGCNDWNATGFFKIKLSRAMKQVYGQSLTKKTSDREAFSGGLHPIAQHSDRARLGRPLFWQIGYIQPQKSITRREAMRQAVGGLFIAWLEPSSICQLAQILSADA